MLFAVTDSKKCPARIRMSLTKLQNMLILLKLNPHEHAPLYSVGRTDRSAHEAPWPERAHLPPGRAWALSCWAGTASTVQSSPEGRLRSLRREAWNHFPNSQWSEPVASRKQWAEFAANERM